MKVIQPILCPNCNEKLTPNVSFGSVSYRCECGYYCFEKYQLFRKEVRVNVGHLNNTKLFSYRDKIQGLTPLCDARGQLGLFTETLIPLKKTSVVLEDDSESWINNSGQDRKQGSFHIYGFAARVHGFVRVFYKQKLDVVKEVLLRKCLEVKTERGWRKYDQA